uniref:Tail protein n=1 Tax=Escherichia phage ETEP102 TaxID=3117680 RepID=A0AAU6PXK0_9CAUD
MVYDDYDLAKAARVALFQEFGSRFKIMAENVEFKEPNDGGTWLKFDYMPAEKTYKSLSRKCIRIRGLVQIGIVFSPDTGTDEARRLAKEIANFFEDGKILSVGFIFEGASQKPVQKSQRGWLIPIRFTVQHDE